jgi:DNA-binding GntR family transcriptional regulator
MVSPVNAKIGDRPRLADDVLRTIRDGVMSGRYPSGQRLAVSDIADDLGVSATPVREALVALTSEGLVDLVPRKGFRVAQIRQSDVEAVFQVHAFVAGRLAAAAAVEISEASIERLRSLQTQIERLAATKPSTARAEGIEDLNFEFHREINKVADARRLRWFLRAASQFVPRRYYEDIPEWIDATLEDHPAIIEALATRDPIRSADLVASHVSRAEAAVIAHLGSRGLWGLSAKEPETDGRG